MKRVLMMSSVGLLGSAIADQQLFHSIRDAPVLPLPLSDYSVDVLDGTAFFVGGCVAQVQIPFTACDNVTAQVFSFQGDSYANDIANAPSPRYRHASVVRGNSLYVIGGLGAGDEAVLDIDVLDLTALTWSTLEAKLPEPIGDAFAFELNGIIYFAGGYKTEDDYNSNDVVFTISETDQLGQEGPALSTPRGDGRAVKIGNTVYVVGGYDASNNFALINYMEVFNGTGWAQVQVPHLPRGDPAATTYQGKLYVIGGEHIGGDATEEIEVFDPQSGSWAEGGFVTYSAQRFHAFVLGERLFLAGGHIPGENGSWVTTDKVISLSVRKPPSAAVFAPLEHRVIELNNLPTVLTDYSVEVVGEDRVIFIGGCSSARQSTGQDGVCPAIDSVYEYTPSEDAFSPVAAAPTPRYRHASTVRGSNIYVVGGLDSNDAAILTIDVLNTDTMTWTTLADQLPQAISDLYAFELNGLVYVGGGYNSDDGYSGNTILFTITEADVLESGAPAAPTQRGDARAVKLGGSVYIIGGYNPAANFAEVAVVDVFDGTTWTEFSEPHEARGDPAVAAYNGRIYVFGGQVSAGAAQDIQILDVSTETWHSGGLIPVATHRMHAFVVQGKVYLGGGQLLEDENWVAQNHLVAYEETSFIYSMPSIALHGSGTSNPEHFFEEIMGNFIKQARVPLSMSYRAVGSGTGIREFEGDSSTMFLPASQFGSGDIPLEEETFNDINERGFTVGQIPFMFGAIGIYVNIPEMNTPDFSGELVLSPCDAAKIYTGEYTKWSDLASDGRNEFLSSVDKTINTVHRRRGSSSTYGFTSFMDGCNDVWKEGVDNGSNLGDQWPCDKASDCSSFVAEGSSGVLRFIDGTDYSIGYLSVGHGYPENLKPAALENNKGEIIPLATPESIRAAGAAFTGWPKKPFESFHDVSLINTDADGAWPIVLVSYLYVRKDQTALGASAQLLKAFIMSILDKSQGQSILEDYNFVGVPDNVLDLSIATVRRLDMPFGSEPFVFETSTMPIAGAQPNVLSTKRGSYAEFLGSSMKSEIRALKTALNVAEKQIIELATMVETDEKQSERSETGSNSDDQAKNLAIAALVFCAINLLLLAIAICVMCGLQRKVNQARKASMKANAARQEIELSQADSEVSESAAVRVV